MGIVEGAQIGLGVEGQNYLQGKRPCTPGVSEEPLQ